MTIVGLIWATVQRFGTLTISFVSNLVLARLLLPEDFGSIGMLMVFIAIANTLVDSGLGSALIQKKQPTDKDYSTVFFFNLTFSLVLYGILFFSAPLIASFYRMEQLSAMLRVMGTMIFISALGIVQSNQLQKQLDFGKLARIEIASMTISTAIGIVLAFLGLGVWSLVVKTVLNSTLNSSLYWFLSRWRPTTLFSFASFKELFGFAGLILLSGLTETIVNQLVSLIIGRHYSPKVLGFYVQAVNLQRIPERTIPFVVNQVFFPVFSSIQDDVDKIVAALRKSLKALTFLNSSLMVVLIVIAKPLIIVLFTDKWLESVPYFQILCCGGMLYCSNSNNLNVLKALGQGKSILCVSIIKRAVTFALIVVGIHFGIYGIVWGSVLSIYLWFPINAYYTGKLTGYGIREQIRDTAPSFVLSIVVGCIVFFAFSFVSLNNNYLLIAFQIASYYAAYLPLGHLFRNEGLSIAKSTFGRVYT